MLILSAAAHSLAGWPALSEELSRTNAPADLVAGLEVGWHFGGVAMLIFGLILIPVFRNRSARREASTLGALIIGGGYLVFGACALVARNFEPFFLVFLIPGAMLVFAGWPGARES